MVCATLRWKIRQRKAGKQPPEQLESGQAAIFALILIPVSVAAVLLIFNTGQVTASKLRVQNAADAAAFSAMELQARQMNLDAYLNRAMLANEVAIGQAVSILSWSRYAEKAGDNIQRVFQVLSGLPVVGQAFQAYGQAVNAVSQAVYMAGTGYAGVFLPLANNMDAAYSGAQQAFNMGLASPDGALQKTVDQVVEINAPGAEVIAYPATAAKYWLDRRTFVTTWGGKKEPNGRDPGGQDRMASMINDSARGQVFTVNRDHATGFPLTFGLPWFPGSIRISTQKSGGGQLAKNQNGNYVWSAADSLSTRAQIGAWCGRWIKYPCWNTRIDQSWAWGGAWSLPSLSSFDYYQGDPVRRNGWQDPTVDSRAVGNAKTVQMSISRVYQDAWSRDGRGMNQIVGDFSGRFAPDALATPGVGRAGEGGIAKYRDLAWSKRVGKQGEMTDTAPKYIVLVSLPVKKVRDSVTALEISGDPTDGGRSPSLGWMGMNLYSKGAGKQGKEGVRAVAAAQVYFRRPDALWPREDGRDERANIFSPFWSARLVDLSTAEKTSILLINSQT